MTLFIGGIKSGKSYHAEQYTKALQEGVKPYYLATTEFIDEELHERIAIHQQRREEHFATLEEPLDLYKVLRQCDGPVLVECTTMWINNMLYHGHTKEQIVEHMEQVLTLPNDLVFVHNDVGSGIIPDNALSRRYVDISGIVSQMIASQCDEVYHCIAGIATRIK
ncbi:MAG: bifunctional adenosylcobinamide kinase/adenosylcobinamide-phosphate guanylyltransferase [Helicobacteraceae bacterium]|jgi:adenosylcobinamide kinase/adenosylcobinamide-phosphate guanylyltransferase|nr:bifunctional adenosylcobinamide kinase/adenosylcobinamide-phosphate guanylyltransferase [Helicobacteraceae bacterium]